INDLMITFYKNKDSNSKDFNKEMIMIYDLKNNKMLKNTVLNYNRFKDAISYDNNNILIISWKPVKLYSFNIQNYKFQEIYENNPQKDKILFTLSSKITKDFNNNIISTVDIRQRDIQITDDIPFSLLKLVNNKLEIIPWVSSIKLNQDIKTFLNKDKINSLYYFVYPNLILVSVDNDKLLKIDTIQEYKGRTQEFNIKEISNNVGVLADYKDNNLLLIKKDGLYLLEDYSKEKQVFKGKVLKARFLDKNNYLYLVLDKQVKLYINNNLSSNNFPYILLNDAQKEKDGYSLICSDNKKIVKIYIKI
ncbi:MAG: hypothetical protein ACP5O4_05490, partial [bacterium]